MGVVTEGVVQTIGVIPTNHTNEITQITLNEPKDTDEIWNRSRRTYSNPPWLSLTLCRVNRFGSIKTFKEISRILNIGIAPKVDYIGDINV